MQDQGIIHGKFSVYRHEEYRKVLLGEYPNALVLAGTHLLLQAGAGLLTGLSGNTLQVSSSVGVIGGPASLGGANNKTFMGVGSGQVATTFSGSVAAGASTSTIASATGLAAGDQVLLTDSSGSGLGSHPEVLYITTLVGTTITWSVPPSYAHASGTKVVRMGSSIDSSLPVGSEYYKGIDSGYPVEGVDSSGNPCLTWQSTFGGSAQVGVNEAAFPWKAAILGIVPLNGTIPSAGYMAGTTTPPSNSTILAVASMVPTPVDKTSINAIYTLQYRLALKLK